MGLALVVAAVVPATAGLLLADSDGERAAQLTGLAAALGLVGVLAAVAATLLILLTVLPFVVLLALVIGLIGTVLGGLVALAPVLIVAGLIWWLVQRSRQPS